MPHIRTKIADHIAVVTMDAPGDYWAHARRAREMSWSMIENKKPIIAAINGPALGAGLGIAVSCDILMASENASVGLPEVDVGLMGSGRHTMRVFGHSLTRRMMLTGYRVPGPDLYRLGIVKCCVPQAQLMDEAMVMATTIAAKSPVATRMAKHAAQTIEFMTLRDGYRFEQNLTHELSRTDDAKEAMRAFAEKRKPNFPLHERLAHLAQVRAAAARGNAASRNWRLRKNRDGFEPFVATMARGSPAQCLPGDADTELFPPPIILASSKPKESCLQKP